MGKFALGTAAALFAACCFGQPLILQKPALSKTQIVFSYAGDLWSVSRDGGEARRLTTGAGVETDPAFSPDGSLIAFTGEYDGNQDVYVMPAEGGVPRRLTYHPGADTALGWTLDGKRVLFRSPRDSYSGFDRLFTIAVDGGGLPEELPLADGRGGFLLAGRHEARVCSAGPRVRCLEAIPRRPRDTDLDRRSGRFAYREAPTRDIERLRSHVDRRPHLFPLGPGGPVTLFYYDLHTKKVVQAIENRGLDIKSASAGPGAIVYEQFGTLHLYDLKSGKEHPVEVRIAADLPQVRPAIEKVSALIQSAGLSPTGARAVFEARGEILTVPAEKGDIRNLTNTPGVAERYPAWSPDGKQVAYFSDESGEYALHIRQQNGMGDVTKLKLPPGFYYSPVWSPDSKKIAFTDKAVNLWYLDLEKREPVRVDQDTYKTPDGELGPAWAPDSRWIAYTKILKNHLRAVFAYSVETGKATQITDGMSDARYAVFDKNGEHLYFTASTDAGPTTGWLDMSRMDRPVTRSVYVVVLRKDLASPLAPESDEEKPKKDDEKKDADKDKEKKEPAPVKIDFDNISQRILALPIPARNYSGMLAGKTGTLFVLEEAQIPSQDSLGNQTVQKFELKTRKTEKFLDDVREFYVSFDGEKALYRKDKDQWFITGTGATPKPGDGALEARPDGGPRRPARRVEADVRRGVADRARLLLRPRPARRGLERRTRRSMRRISTGSAAAKS